MMNAHGWLVPAMPEVATVGAHFRCRYSRHTVVVVSRIGISITRISHVTEFISPHSLASLLLASCSPLATLPAQATDRRDSRDVRQEVRPEIRDAKQGLPRERPEGQLRVPPGQA